MQLLTANGVQGTPMSAIAKAADTGMGTIYNYFTTKEDLINAIYIFIKNEEFKNTKLLFNDESLKMQFDRHYGAVLHYYINHPKHFKFIDQFHNSPLLTEVTKKEEEKAVSVLTQMILKGQKHGILKSIDIDEIMHFLNGGLMGFTRWVLSSDIVVTKTLIDNQLRMAWDVIRL